MVPEASATRETITSADNLDPNVPATLETSTPKPKFTKKERSEDRQARILQEKAVQVPNLEHMQLQREEAFFLAFCTEALAIYNTNPHGEEDGHTLPMALSDVWMLFLQSRLALPHLPASASVSQQVRPDNPFIISYLVYHHYRSLGWVVRNGVKFCTDWVLYKGADGTPNMRGGAGPVGGHAE